MFSLEGVRGVSSFRHEINGLPTNPSKQEHTGAWLTAWHTEFSPQTPGQGSLHLFWIQAK